MQRRHLLGSLGALGAGFPGRSLGCEPLHAALLPYASPRVPAARSLDAQLIQALASALPCTLAWRETHVKRLWPDIAQGRVGLSAGVAYLPERESQVDFLLLSSQRALVLLRREQAERTPSREAFDADPRLVLGVLRGARRGAQAQAWVDALRPQGRVSEGMDMAGLHRGFAAGRVHAMLMLPRGLEGCDAVWWQRHALPDWLPQDRVLSGIAASHAALPAAQRGLLRQRAQQLLRDGVPQQLALAHLGETVARGLSFLPPA